LENLSDFSQRFESLLKFIKGCDAPSATIEEVVPNISCYLHAKIGNFWIKIRFLIFKVEPVLDF
jgi:hypothetical protein